MEILSDATFKGNLTISGGDFSVTRKGESRQVIKTISDGVSINGNLNISGSIHNPIGSNININSGVRIEGTEIVNSTLDVYGDTHIHDKTVIGGDFSVTPKGESSPSFVVGSLTTNNGATGSEFQSTTIGGVFVNKDFYVDPIDDGTGLEISKYCGVSFKSSVYFGHLGYFANGACIHGGAIIYDGVSIHNDLNVYANFNLNGESISKWSDLNSLLSFAPASLSSTVSSNTSKINSVCTAVSSLCTKVNSLCTTVSSLCSTVESNSTGISSICATISNYPRIGSMTVPFDVPADCTKFLICGGTDYPAESTYYMFMTKGTNPMKPVNIDLEARWDSTTGGKWKFIATKSSGFAMCYSDNYKLTYFYK